MTQDVLQNREAEAPKPRIVQYRNRRFSVRLEPVFWRALDVLADRAGIRLGRYIFQLYERSQGGNFSSFLRSHCMLRNEERLAEYSLVAEQGNLMDVLRAAPAPGLILSRYRSIIGTNASFLEWLGPTDVSLTGVNLTSLIQVRTREPLNEVWQHLLSGKFNSVDARVLYVAPGRVNAAQASFVALHSREREEFYALMWLSVTQGKAMVTAKPAR